jgi:hypothetical protein
LSGKIPNLEGVPDSIPITALPDRALEKMLLARFTKDRYSHQGSDNEKIRLTFTGKTGRWAKHS